MTTLKKTYVVIGGVAGGATAATRLRRLDESAQIVLLERGPHVSFANCGLPYHISGEIEDRDDLLVQTPAGLRSRYGLDVRTRHEALSIDAAKKTLKVQDLEQGTEYTLAYDGLILSPGAAAVRLDVPGVDLPGVRTLRNIADMDAIKALAEAHPQGRALVLGGGAVGLEMAEALRHRGLTVQMVEWGSQVLGPADPEMAAYLHRELRAQGVELALKTGLKSIALAADGRLEAELSDGSRPQADLILLSTGVRPETTLATRAGLALGPRGGIRVDAQMRTSDPSIYAVGDAVEVMDTVTGRGSLIALAGPANRQGRIAADGLAGLQRAYAGTQGTAIVRVFGVAFGMTGASEKALVAAGRSFAKIYLHPDHHAAYFPGAKQLHLKLLFDPTDGRVLGAQAVGEEGVDKRIDVLAVAIKAKLCVQDLKDLELSYAPPFGSAKDPINVAGLIATDVMEGLSRVVHSPELVALSPEQILLDIRSRGEHAAGAIPGSLNIPLDQLRQRMDELPKDKEILLYCRVGLRGYLASRILTQAGYRCRNLSGGYLTWQAFQEAA